MSLDYNEKGNRESVNKAKQAQKKKMQGKELQRKSAEGRPVQRKPAEGRPVQRKPAEGRPVQRKPAEGRPAQRKPAGGRPAQRKPAEERSAQRNPAMENPAKGSPEIRNPELHKKQQQRRKSRRRKNKKADLISTVVLIVAVCVFVISLYQLVRMLIPYYSGGQEYDKMKELVITTDKDDKNVFKVDFDKLLAENSDTIGWIRFEEPQVISYPVVKSADNAEYLTKTFSANDNKLGSIFMDMRSNSDFSDRNTFIYGHNMKVGGEMFSQLNEYASEDFCKKYPYFYIYTPDGKTRMYKIFSAAVVKDTAENYEMTYASDEEYTKYLELCKETSNYQVDVTLDTSSKIVSLSTCTNVNDDERFLVQGVLIEESESE